jgi:hypothetical protein
MESRSHGRAGFSASVDRFRSSWYGVTKETRADSGSDINRFMTKNQPLPFARAQTNYTISLLCHVILGPLKSQEVGHGLVMPCLRTTLCVQKVLFS